MLLDVAVLAKPRTVATVNIVLQLRAESTVGAINYPASPLCQRLSTLAAFLCKLKQHQRWQRKEVLFAGEKHTSLQLDGGCWSKGGCAFILPASAVITGSGIAP